MATLATIRTAARIRADQDSSTFPTDAQYTVLIDSAGKEVWYELVRSGWPVGYISDTVSLGATGRASFASLGHADPVMGIRGVFRLDGDTWVELQRLNEGDRASAMSSTGALPAYYDYTLDPTDGPTLEVFPPAAGQFKLHYIREFLGFTTENTPWPGPARSDEMVILRAAMKACRKEGNDQGARFLEGEYEYLKQCVQDMASWANMRHSAMIRDVGNPLGRSRMPGDFDVYGPDH
jgi:hypothetical protein